MVKQQPLSRTLWQTLSLRHVYIIFFLGLSSGFPLQLTLSTAPAWFASENVNMHTIGALSLLGLPYTWKFFWSPLVDRFSLPFLSRRRAWIAVMQILIAICIFYCAFLSPTSTALQIGLILFALAFCSATQDIAINAYQTEVLTPSERGLGAALYVWGFRGAMLLTGGFAITLAGIIGWHWVFILIAIFMLIQLATTFVAPEVSKQSPPRTIAEAVFEPFIDFTQRRRWLAILLFLLLYKLGDNFAQALLSAFFIKGLGYSLIEVGSAYKIVGFVATLIGVYIGGLLVMKKGLFFSLLVGGVLQMAATLGFLLQAYHGRDVPLLFIVIFFEAFVAGVGTSAFLAFIMSICNQKFTATQFALFSSIDSIPRTIVGPIAADIQIHYGWIFLFIFAFAMALPGIIVLIYLRVKKTFIQNHTTAIA